MKIGILSNFTSAFISDYLIKHSDFQIIDYGYNQYSQQIFDSRSKFYIDNPDYSVLLLEGNNFVTNKSSAEIRDELSSIIENFLQFSNGILIVSNLIIYEYENKIGDFNTKDNFKRLQYELNLFLNDLAIKNERIFIFDIISICERYGYQNIFDNGLWLSVEFRFSAFGLKIISELISTYITSLTNRSKKCLIVDLDNTLWGGILGEDENNIKLGTDRIGNIYVKVQKIIKSIKERGIILCICSKNNESDVTDIFNKNHNFILSINDFVIKKINWESKDKNISEIVKLLNISEDSCVFIDDSQFERELVKKNCNVCVPDYPSRIEDLPKFWSDIDFNYFSKLKLTLEDIEKSKQYETNIYREQLKANYTKYDDYLKELNLKLTIKTADKNEVVRLSQLTQKTNQFNFTTNRYSEAEILNLLNDKNTSLFSIYLDDKYGNYGLIGIIILVEKDNEMHINTFLLSCRVIGRNIEHRIIFELFRVFQKPFIGYYIPTNKNLLIENKYDEIGFVTIQKHDNLKVYKLSELPTINLQIMEALIER